MSATDRQRRARRRTAMQGPRADDPRVVRSRAAVVDAARKLFLSQGYSGTTMEEIAALAGLTKRTVYNNYGDKDALFTQIIADTFSFVESFVHGLDEEFALGVTASNLRDTLDDLGRRLALTILRPEVIALRRLLIGEAQTFPGLAAEYFDRAPGQVMKALASGFENLSRRRLLQIDDADRAAAQFAYLIAGEPLDRAVLVGSLPTKEHVIACAREGVETFLTRYGVARGGHGRRS